MVQSSKYYKSRAVGVMSEVGLTTDRDLAEPLCLWNTTSFIPSRYRKSRGTSHYTTLSFFLSFFLSFILDDRLIDFNGMSTCLGLFQTSKLENYVHFAYLIVVSWWGGGSRTYRIQIIFKQTYLTHWWHPNKYNPHVSEWIWE